MKKRSSTLASVAAAMLLITILPAVQAAPAPALEAATAAGDPASPSGPVKVLITFRSFPGESDAAAITQSGGTVERIFTLIPTIAASVPQTAVFGLQSNPRILRIEPNVDVHLATDPELANSWGVAQIGAGTTHTDPAGSTGSGVKVAVIDSGIAYTHPDLNANYAGGANFLGGSPSPLDDNGHGTHVSGIIAAEMGNTAETVAAFNSNGVVGVAPSASLYALKVVDASGNGDYSNVIAALQWAVTNHMDVVNISLGAHVDTQALHDAISATWNAGIVIVAASGNVNLGDFNEIINGCPVAFPAAYPEAIAVSFTDTSNSLTGLSCTGPQVFLAAPGDNVVSTVPTGSCMFCTSVGYAAETGTSMASPHVAGVAALILSKGIADTNGNGRKNDEVKAQLCATATQGAPSSTDPAYPSHYGCGVVNAYNAVVTQPFTGSGGSPSAAFTAPAAGATVTTPNTTNTFTWTEDAAGSGVRSRYLTQEAGTVVTPGTCAGVTWATRWTQSFTSPFTTGGYQTNTCYRYTLSLNNGAGGTASAGSGNLLVDIGPPPSPSAAFTSPALGDTLASTNWSNTITWTESDGGSGGNGIASRSLTQQAGPVVTPGTCSGVTWTTRWTASYASPFTTGGYQTNTCYRYTLSLINGGGNTATASSGNLVVTLPPPPDPSATFTAPALGDTVISASATNTITWTESDGGTGGFGIAYRNLTQQAGPVVTPGSCAGVTWVTRWTAGYTSPFTTGGYQTNTCYRYTLSLTNSVGVTASASSGNLLVDTGLAPSPSATFISPALGTTVTSTSSTNTISWTESDGGTGGGGIVSRSLTQESGPVVTPGTCSGVTWTTSWTAAYTSPFTIGGYQSNTCYRYTLSLTNGANRTATASSGNLIVNLPASPSLSATFTSPALGSTLTSTTSVNTITWTESIGSGGSVTSRNLTQQSGPVVTPGTCAGVTWATGWTKTFTSPFTTGGYKAGYCYRYTLTIANGAGDTATATSGSLLINKKN
jgi:subtilisin